MSFALFNLFVDTACVVCIALFGAGVLAAGRRSLNAWLIGALCLCAVCNQVLGRQEFAPFEPAALRIDVGGWAPALNLVRNTAPGLFMILVHRLFVDGRPLPPLLWTAFGVQLALELLTFRAPVGPLTVAPALLQLLFGALALYWTLAPWSADLIARRRGTRALVFVVLTVNMVASSLLLRLLIHDGPAAYDVHGLLSGFGLATTVLLLARRMRMEVGADLDPARKPEAPSPIRRTAAEDLVTLRTLERLIRDERVFLEPGLSLKALADRVGTPEYRLRRVIHETLGHPNFNAFLHSVRIAEACRRLDAPNGRRTPILTIALSVGYNSANTFNRGFREVMGCTPSAYRARGTGGDDTPNPEKPSQILQSA